jgi:Xaa-Pro aminopeptidase
MSDDSRLDPAARQGQGRRQAASLAVTPPAVLAARLTGVRRQMRELGLTTFLATGDANTRYLTGFDGAVTGGIVVSDRGATAILDSRYEAEAAHALRAVLAPGGPIRVVGLHERNQALKQAGAVGDQVLGIDEDGLTVAEYNSLVADLPGSEIRPGPDIVARERLVKEPRELARIRAAAALSDAAFVDLIAVNPVGWTEREIAHYLETRMMLLGATALAFGAVVAVGARTALPHARPGDTVLSVGEPLLVDFGAQVDGYSADMARTVWWGNVSRELEGARAAVLEAIEVAKACILPGVDVGTVDDAAGAVFEKHAMLPFVRHPSGHNIGLEVHERPYLTPRHQGKLEVGQTITLEPGLYIPGVGGFRVEDTILVTGHGPARLTTATHDSYVGPGTEPETSDLRAGDGPAVDDTRVDTDALDQHRSFLIGDEPRDA